MFPIDLSACSTPGVPCSDIQIRRVNINKANKVLWICLLTLISVSSCCLSVLASDDGLNTTEKRINQLGFAHFLSFRYFSIKIDKINRLIAEIDNHKNMTY